MLVVRLLGQFNVLLNDQTIEISSRPAQTLLAYLTLHPGTAFRREMLSGLIWPDANESNARSNLRHALWRIRKAIGEQVAQDYFPADDLTLMFWPEPGSWIDAVVVGSKADAAASALEEQVAAYQGDLLPGFYDDWITIERERLQTAFESKCEVLIDRLSREKHWPDVIEWAEHWIKFGAAPEPAYRALMLAHARSGHRAKVKEAYQRCVEALQREFGVEPSEETRELYHQLVSTRPLVKVTAAEPPATRRHNLPIQATPLIGRETELAEITDRLLNDPDCRLLTLVGPGGIGKTRLALQAATQALDQFEDGVFFVSFEAITAAGTIASTILRAVLSTVPDQKDPDAQLLDYVRDKNTLLVLDNLEHLLEGATLIGALLAAAPAAKIIVTSRERLHLQWEWLYEVHGLDYPREAEDVVESYSAVKLFLQTARRMRARFSLAEEQPHVIRICQLVEGLPLGLELAASWVRVMSCREIAQQIERNLDLLSTRLQDMPKRHRSARAVFEYSWSLLAPEEQAVFMKLAAFPGSFRREAAEKVAGAPLSLLFTLVDKSLLRASAAGRYDMHSLLRQFVTEKLAQASQAAELQTSLIDYYLDFARQHQHDYKMLEDERFNVMACMEESHRTWEAQYVLDYAAALSEMWSARGHWSDARKGYAWACDAARAHGDDAALASYLHRWGNACIEQGNYDEAETILHQSLVTAQAIGDSLCAARVQNDQAWIAIERSDFQRAQGLLAESLTGFEAMHDTSGIAEALFRQAWVQFYYAQFDTAEQLAQRAFQLNESIGNISRCIPVLGLLANIALNGRQDYATAEQYCLQAIQLSQQVNDNTQLAATLDHLAEAHRRQGRLREARSEAERSLELFRAMGDRKLQAHILFRLSQIDFDTGDLHRAQSEGQAGLKLCQDLQDPWGAVYIQLHLGDVYSTLGQIAQACQIWAQAYATAVELNHPALGPVKERLKRCE